MKNQIDIALLSLAQNPLRIKLINREARERCRLAERFQRGQEDRRRHVVRCGHAPGIFRFLWFERCRRGDHRLQGRQRMTQRLPQGVGSGRWPHPTRSRQKQRIVKNIA
ncbi:hypothetical protein D3C78_957970 [compost metagenome]